MSAPAKKADAVLEEIRMGQVDPAALCQELADRVLDALSAERAAVRAQGRFSRCQGTDVELAERLADVELAERASREAQTRIWDCLYGAVRPRLEEAEQ